ncbi:MAG: cobalamin B12-binding domain-containing protein [Deltaproteobacteria bacterium]|nr:cobalamin B12-binding domain-containing protein [Deltaproteobacteria bacterium]
MRSQRRIRVLLAKPGIDGHDVGIKVVASALRDAGMEVIYLGLRRTPEQVVSAALEEDCDVIGLNFHSFGHRTLVPEVVRLLREKGMEDVLLLAGGSILDKDAQELRAWGVSEVFGVGSRVDEIVRYIQENAR